MTTPVRFAILGFGHHGARRLVPAFAQSQQAVLTGIWRRNQAAAAQDCATHGIPHCFPTAEALCASPEVDAVFITSPDAMHHQDVLLALSHGKAVLCEKPLTMNAREAEELADAAELAGLLFGVAQNFRYNRTLDWLRQQVQDGRIGTPQLAHAQYTYPADKAPRTWIKDPSLACGGPIGDVGVHCIDSLRYVLGGEVESVSTLAHPAPAPGQVESRAVMQLEMSGGLLGNVSVSASAPYRSLIEIAGTEGVLIAENGLSVDWPVRVERRRAAELLESATLDNRDGYIRMIDGFVEAFRGGQPFRATGRDGVQNMRILDAAYCSWHTGGREPV